METTSLRPKAPLSDASLPTMTLSIFSGVLPVTCRRTDLPPGPL